MTSESTLKTESQKEGQEPITPLFHGSVDDDDDNSKPSIVSFADGFRDKVRVLFEYFDQDRDGYLNFEELKALQDSTTTGTKHDDGDDSSDDTETASTPTTSLTEEMYVMACKALNCHPSKGLSLEALKFTYAADGADIDKDYNMIFTEDGKPKMKIRCSSGSQPKTKTNNNQGKETKSMMSASLKDNDNEKIYEVGDDGTIDISS